MIRPSVLVSLGLALATGSSAVTITGQTVTGLTFTAQTQTICKTFYASGATSGPVETISETQTFSLNPTVTSTSTPLTTQTPATTTETSTNTIILTGTALVVTDTFFSTTTVVESTTESIITTTTSTAVEATLEVLPTVTSISDAPDGFLYPTPSLGNPTVTEIALPARALAETKRSPSRLERLRRFIEEPRNALKALVKDSADGRSVQGPVKLPFRVVCEVVVESIIPTTVTATASVTSTVFAATPTFTTTVDVNSVTVEAPPDASATVIFTDTNTATFTSTSTVSDSTTVTVTATYQPVETFYSQCGPQNQISQDPANTMLSLAQDLGDTVIVLNTPDAYSCCVQCMNTAGCAGSNWIPEFYADGESCGLDIFQECSNGQSQIAGTYYASNDLSNTFSNGPCGTYQQIFFD